MAITKTVFVTYDVSDDPRRAKVAALLQQWGDRVQRSVFLCVLDDGDLSALQERLDAMIDPGTDSLYIVRQCASCHSHLHVTGQGQLDPAPHFWAVL